MLLEGPSTALGTPVRRAPSERMLGDLADFQRRQGDSGKGGSQKPEPHHYLWFAPADQVEMVVDGRASKEPLSPRVFEIAHLKHYAEQLHDKDTADDEKKNFISRNQRAVAHRHTQRK